MVAAGPIANFLLAVAIFATMFMLIGLRSTAARVDEVVANLPAAKAGIQVGDIITDIDGRKIESFNDVLRIVGTSPDRELLVGVNRDGERFEFEVRRPCRSRATASAARIGAASSASSA